jgi:nicotinamide-nucleotide amidase
MNPTDIHLLLTGDELMSGDTVDSNSSMIAQSLAAFGHGVAEKVTLGDDRARLVAALQRAAGTARILIMNGGLGPTQDDLTAELVAGGSGRRTGIAPRGRQACAGLVRGAQHRTQRRQPEAGLAPGRGSHHS